MPTPTVDWRQVSLLSEIVLRGGDFAHPAAQSGLKAQYARSNVHYPNVRAGLSCLFRPGASLDELAREGSYRNPKLSDAVLDALIRAMTAVDNPYQQRRP